MIITYSSAAAQWQEFLFILAFSVMMGTILGGIVEQTGRPKSAQRHFWPSRWAPIVISALLATLGGAWWGKAAALDRIYLIECAQGQVTLSRAGALRPTRIAAESILEVRRRLVTSRGARPWTLRIYDNNAAPTFETARISDNELGFQAERLTACIALARQTN